ncbi:MAG: hypothetical protein E6G64_10680 [Actinobacteria bacterium]|nr:MAG: hypothetical protein E6G64_10680 [Actinomycetota bacterium]
MGCALTMVLMAAGLGISSARAEDGPGPEPGVLQGAYQSPPVTPVKLNVDLSTLPRVEPGPFVPATPSDDDQGEENPEVGTPGAAAVDGGVLRVTTQIRRAAVAPEEFTTPNPNFNGIGYTALVPPDPNGDVGPSNYVQMVNSQFQIFDKQGNSLAGPTNINQLWIAAGQNNACSQNNNGDPVVVYDNLADRWVMSQFAVPNGFQTPPTFECIAVSQTANPVTGGWFLYLFQFNFAHDYPKLGVWPDAYYLSSQRGFSGGSLNAVAFDRTQMLAGNPATFQAFNPAGPALILLPSDLDGPVPPAGTPNFYARAVDGGLWGGNDRIDLFAFHVDWTTRDEPLRQLRAAAGNDHDARDAPALVDGALAVQELRDARDARLQPHGRRRQHRPRRHPVVRVESAAGGSLVDRPAGHVRPGRLASVDGQHRDGQAG